MENVGNIDEERGDKAIVDTLLSDTFNSILRIEERSLKNRLTEGLSIAELHTIVAVGLHEINSMKVVASRLDVTMATLTAAMNKLERKGFVERSRSEIDRRQVLVQLTSKGDVYKRQVTPPRALFGAGADGHPAVPLGLPVS